MHKSELDHAWDPRELDDAADLGAAIAGEPEAPPFDDLPWPTEAAARLPDLGHVDGERPIPHLTLEAFCERAEVAAMIGAAAADRRMAKAHVNVTRGGVSAAIAQLGAKASPNLLIIDSPAAPAALLAELDRLAQVVDGGAKVLVIGATNDIALYRELMRRGVDEYLVAPVRPLALIRAIAALFADPDKPFLGRTAAVVGAKGGVGASILAHNVAWALAHRFDANTTLVDMDLAFGTASLDFNQEPSAHFGDALVKGEQLDEAQLDRMLSRPSERLSLFMAPGTLEDWYAFGAERFELVLDRVRRTAPFVVLDVPHVWTDWTRQALIGADDIVIVTTPDLAGLRNCKNLVDLIKSGRPNDPPPRVVLNMTGVPRRPEIPAADFADALGAKPSISIPFDPALFGQAANNGQMIFEIAPNAPAAQAVEALARMLCGREPSPKARRSILDRLLRR